MKPASTAHQRVAATRSPKSRAERATTISGATKWIEVAGAGGGARVLKAPRVLLATGSEPVPLPALPFDGVALGEALGATTDGLGEGSGADGRTRATSRLPFRSWMVFWPYLAYNHLVFGLWRRLTREPAYTEIVPGLLLAVWALLVGFARVALGVHYLLDVLAGWLLGLAIGAGVALWLLHGLPW